VYGRLGNKCAEKDDGMDYLFYIGKRCFEVGQWVVSGGWWAVCTIGGFLLRLKLSIN